MYRPLSQKLGQLKTLHNSKPCTEVWPLMGKRAFRFLKDYFLGYNSKFGLNKIFYFFLSIDWLIFHEQYTFLYKHRNTLRYTCVRVLPGGSDGKESVCKYWTPGFDPLDGMIPKGRQGTCSSILAGRPPWTGEPVRLHMWVAKSWTWLNNDHFHFQTYVTSWNYCYLFWILKAK